MKREKYLWLTRYNLCRVEDSKDAVEQQNARKDKHVESGQMVARSLHGENASKSNHDGSC